MRRRGRSAELLSPAGSYDAARAAVNAGADAIYMGGPSFSARAYAESSSEEMLGRSIEFCHLRGTRVFMTLNTLIKEREFGSIADYLARYVEQGLDGVIVQDLGVMRLVRKEFPGLKLHVSTQAAVTGPLYAALLMEAGASRIVLARELGLREIRHIYEETGAELEVFAHGALCYSYSGECLMSSMIGGRSGNRGRCAGTCRLPYEVYADAGRLNRGDGKYVLSMKDLNTVARLKEMLDAGVYSFKIEGRMKSPEYVAAVTSVYRKYLDAALWEVQGKSDGGPAEAECAQNGNIPDGMAPDRRDMAFLSETFDRGGVTSGYLDGKNGTAMVAVSGKPGIRARDEAVIEEIRAEYIDKDRKHPVRAHAVLRKGLAARLELVSERAAPYAGDGADSCPDYIGHGFAWGAASGGQAPDSGSGADGGVHAARQGEIPDTGSRAESGRAGSFAPGTAPGVAVCSDFVVQEARSRPVTREDAASRLGRFGDTEFELSALDIDMDEDIFVPVKVLNELRRRSAVELRDKILGMYRR